MRVAVLRTSDRVTARRCRRRWKWSSLLWDGLESNEPATPLWLGIGFHFALEDYHGYQNYSTLADALNAFAEACRRTPKYNMPDDWRDALDLGRAMLDYYEVWLETRDPLATYYIGDVPQVEVTFEVEVPYDATKYGYDKVVYQGAFDRVAIDEYGNLWIVEYKTAKQFEDKHLMTDQQVSSYCWAGSVVFEKPVLGVVYQQHKKVYPEGPRILANGTVSVAKNMITSSRLYKHALENLYGSAEKAPQANIHYLNNLHFAETEHRDAYIRRDIATRNAHQIAAEGEKICMECEDLLNPKLPLYPNPTRECTYCPFETACISMDDGGDWEADLAEMTQKRSEDYHSWRPYLQPASPQPAS